MSRWNRLVPGAAVLFYLLIALEAVIMITPFTVYFYALYAPVLSRLEAHPWSAWLTAFFLPHITYPGSPALTALAWLGPVLLTVGLLIFFVAAVHVYSAKLLRRGVVSGGLYRFIRHPQYLGLGVAGLGLLLYWPRFIILLLYLSMLFVYSLLARHEEARMAARFPEAYRHYREGTWMFLPREPGGKLFTWLLGWTNRRGWALATAYVAVLVLGTGLAFGARAYSLSWRPLAGTAGAPSRCRPSESGSQGRPGPPTKSQTRPVSSPPVRHFVLSFPAISRARAVTPRPLVPFRVPPSGTPLALYGTGDFKT